MGGGFPQKRWAIGDDSILDQVGLLLISKPRFRFEVLKYQFPFI